MAMVAEICLALFFIYRADQLSASGNTYRPFFLIPTLILAIFFFLSFILTWFNTIKSSQWLQAIFVNAPAPYILILITIASLLVCSTIFFILADTLEIAQYQSLMPFAVLGYVLFWEVIVLFAYTRKETRNHIKYWVWLPFVLAGNYFLWHKLANAGRYLQPFLPNVYPDETITVFSTYKWWQLLLPIKEFKNNWPFGLVLTYLFENVIGTAGVWYVYQTILSLTAFFLSYKVFRSQIFSYILVICLGFGTHHYHAFQYSGITGFYLLQTLILLLLYLSYEYIRAEGKQIKYLIAIVPVLILTAIYYEGWLDFLAAAWLIAIFLYFYLRKKELTRYLRSLFTIFALFNLVLVAYLTINLTYTKFAHTSGESALVLFYGKEFFWRAVEDVISNYFTNLYVTLTNFLPPGMLTSNALYQYADFLEARPPLTYYNYVFYWRYFAGALAVLFFMFLINKLKLAFKEAPFSSAFPAVIFGIMVAVNGATHTIIQFLPMRSMPVFGYYVQQGVLGFSLLIAYLISLFSKNRKDKKIVALVLFLVIATILWSSIRRPNYLWHMIEVVAIDHQGPYPNPLNTLIITIRRVFFPNFLL